MVDKWYGPLEDSIVSPSFHRYLSEYFESWMRLIFPETRYLGLQFEHKNEAISIRIESDMIFWSWLYMLLQQLRENQTLLAPHSYQSSYLMHQISPKAKMRSRFMILYQPSLNNLPFIFLPLLLYIPPLSFIPRHKKKKKKKKKKILLFFSLEF